MAVSNAVDAALALGRFAHRRSDSATYPPENVSKRLCRLVNAPRLRRRSSFVQLSSLLRSARRHTTKMGASTVRPYIQHHARACQSCVQTETVSSACFLMRSRRVDKKLGNGREQSLLDLFAAQARRLRLLKPPWTFRASWLSRVVWADAVSRLDAKV